MSKCACMAPAAEQHWIDPWVSQPQNCAVMPRRSACRGLWEALGGSHSCGPSKPTDSSMLPAACSSQSHQGHACTTLIRHVNTGHTGKRDWVRGRAQWGAHNLCTIVHGALKRERRAAPQERASPSFATERYSHLGCQLHRPTTHTAGIDMLQGAAQVWHTTCTTAATIRDQHTERPALLGAPPVAGVKVNQRARLPVRVAQPACAFPHHQETSSKRNLHRSPPWTTHQSRATTPHA
jgi:hypothetical protein